MDRAEEHLRTSSGPYYYGDQITEADIRLFTTIVRFDVVYVQHFKASIVVSILAFAANEAQCNIRDIRSGYPALHKWLRKLYWDVPAFKDTTEFTHIKNHYTKSHHQINPYSVTPLGPLPNILPKDEEVPAASK